MSAATVSAGKCRLRAPQASYEADRRRTITATSSSIVPCA